MNALARIDWRRCTVQALLASLLHAFAFNAGYLEYLATHDARGVAVHLVSMHLSWCVLVLPLVASAQWVEGRFSWPATAAIGAAACLLLNLHRDLNFIVLSRTLDWSESVLVSRTSPLSFVWLSFVIGAPLFWYCLVVQRAVRVRGVLARADFERARSVALVGQAQADALEGRVDPALLQRALVALQAAYGRGRVQAEALLDALVDFLRQAMPAIRVGRSTLMDELTLLRRYTDLVYRVDGGRRLCSIDVEPPPHDLPFAPLLLVPLVESLAAASTAPPHVRLAVADGALQLTFDAPARDGWLSDALARRLDRAMHTLARPARARYQVGESRPLTLWLPLLPTPEEVRT